MYQRYSLECFLHVLSLNMLNRDSKSSTYTRVSAGSMGVTGLWIVVCMWYFWILAIRYLK